MKPFPAILCSLLLITGCAVSSSPKCKSDMVLLLNQDEGYGDLKQSNFYTFVSENFETAVEESARKTGASIPANSVEFQVVQDNLVLDIVRFSITTTEKCDCVQLQDSLMVTLIRRYNSLEKTELSPPGLCKIVQTATPVGN